jgi:hypothetical protein
MAHYRSLAARMREAPGEAAGLVKRQKEWFAAES